MPDRTCSIKGGSRARCQARHGASQLGRSRAGCPEARPPEANLTASGRLPAVAPARAAAALCLRMSAASGPWGRTEAICVLYLTGSSLGDPQSSIPAIPGPRGTRPARLIAKLSSDAALLCQTQAARTEKTETTAGVHAVANDGPIDCRCVGSLKGVLQGQRRNIRCRPQSR
jgi:hypothetical protein